MQRRHLRFLFYIRFSALNEIKMLILQTLSEKHNSLRYFGSRSAKIAVCKIKPMLIFVTRLLIKTLGFIFEFKFFDFFRYQEPCFVFSFVQSFAREILKIQMIRYAFACFGDGKRGGGTGWGKGAEPRKAAESPRPVF